MPTIDRAFFTVSILVLVLNYAFGNDFGSSEVAPVSPLTPDDKCNLCQQVLRHVYSHFSGHIPSRRKLSNQLKHECNRHFNYRRRCLLMLKDQTEELFLEMGIASTPFKPYSSCFRLKECKPVEGGFFVRKFGVDMLDVVAELAVTDPPSTSSEAPPQISPLT